MQTYITFVPNLTSSSVHLLPQSSLPSFSLHQVFPRYKKENADLHNLKKRETTAFGTGMARFFSRSLKCTVWVIWGSENSAEPGLFNSLISGGRAVGVDKHQAGNAECHTREDPKKVSLQWRLWVWKQWHHTSSNAVIEPVLLLLGSEIQGWGHFPSSPSLPHLPCPHPLYPTAYLGLGWWVQFLWAIPKAMLTSALPRHPHRNWVEVESPWTPKGFSYWIATCRSEPGVVRKEGVPVLQIFILLQSTSWGFRVRATANGHKNKIMIINNLIGWLLLN